ncbi:MAG: hypothetical protein ACD_43C00226G0002 [uncultured bacterium]|nr:MAG: hypothetical protein ACD_43C00226G0002 [uncultured bacterium]
MLKQHVSKRGNSIKLMGIVNVTPDSFSDGGKFMHTQTAVKQALQLLAEGAACIDIGGESSRPGAANVSETEELRRVLPVIKALRRQTKTLISIDTYKPNVAAAALQAGANCVNDITGLADQAMRQLIAKTGCPVVLMHMQGTPRTMQKRPYYKDVVRDICDFFTERLALARSADIARKQIILDPGIGFGKSVKHNLEIIRRLGEFKKFRLPILVGASRKSFIGKLTSADVTQRLPGTLAAHNSAVQNGATWLRVHDVAAHKQYLMISHELT